MSSIGIKELAKQLGISTASVSRALNKPERVSTEMRDRVRKAAEELGYRTNMIGSSLRTAKTKSIMAIIPDLCDTFNSGVISSMESTAAEAGYSVLFGDSKGLRQRELGYGSLVQRKQADGVIYFSPLPPFDETFLKSDIGYLPPMVNSCEVIDPQGYEVRGQRIPYVTIDNVLAAREVVNHLIELGHKRIAVITGGETTPSAVQRLEGYRQAHSEAGLTVDESLILHGEYTIESGEHLCKELVKLDQRPTAIFCMCDEGAMGAMQTLRENNIRIPADIALAGFDDIRFANYLSPRLTTVAQPVHELGEQCMKLLIRIIEGKPVENPTVVLPHKLVVRESTVG